MIKNELCVKNTVKNKLNNINTEQIKADFLLSSDIFEIRSPIVILERAIDKI